MLCYFIMKHIDHNAVTCLDVFTFGVTFQISSSAEKHVKKMQIFLKPREILIYVYTLMQIKGSM